MTLTDHNSSQIRPAELSDLAALNALMQSSSAYTGKYRAILDGYEIAARQIENNHLALMDDHGKVIGFYSLVGGAEPELDLMFVRDDTQGCGCGKRLFTHLIATAIKLSIPRFKIISHPPAVGFYQHMRATLTGTSPPSGRATWSRPVLVVDITY